MTTGVARLAGSAGRLLALVAAATIGACDSDSPDVAAPTTTYAVSFDLEATDGPLGALQFDVEYRGGGEAGWVGAGGGAACRWIVQAAIHACNDKRGGKLTCAVVDTGGFSGPTPLLECVLVSKNDAVTADDFDVRVTDASTPWLEPIDVEVRVNSVVARPESTTTTTNPDDPPDEYDVVFAVSDDDQQTNALIGSLQLEITHDGVAGGWIGSGAFVDCQWLASGEVQVQACNENSNQLLTCGIGSSAGFSGPLSILSCGFATYEPIVEPSDFDVEVIDSSTPDLFPIDVYVFVSSVTPR